MAPNYGIPYKHDERFKRNKKQQNQEKQQKQRRPSEINPIDLLSEADDVSGSREALFKDADVGYDDDDDVIEGYTSSTTYRENKKVFLILVFFVFRT